MKLQIFKLNFSTSNLFFMLVLTTVLILKEIMGISVPVYAIVGFATLPLLILPANESIKYTYFLLPIGWYYPGFTILLALLILLLRNRHYTGKTFIYYSTLIIVLETAHCLMYDFAITISQPTSTCSFLAMFFYLLFAKNKISYADCIIAFSLGTLVSLVTSYGYIISNSGIDALITGALRGGFVDTVIVDTDHPVLNANSAAYIALASFVSLLFSKKELNLPNTLYFLLVILLFFLGLLSFSRTYILISGLSLIIFILFSNTKNKFSILGVSAVAFLLLLFLVPSFYEAIENSFLVRFSESNLSTANGRTEIFTAYNEWWFSHPYAMILGTGITYYNYVVPSIGHSIHCGFQQLYVCCGIYGVFIFLIAALRFKKIFVPQNMEFSYYIPFLLILAFNQSIQMLYPQFLIFPFLVTSCVLRVKNNFQS